MGAVVCRRGRQYVYHSHVPEWMAGRAGIYEFEMAGALLSGYAHSSWSVGHISFFFMIIVVPWGPQSGQHRKPSLGVRFVRSFQPAAAAEGCSFWIGFLASLINLSDALLGSVRFWVSATLLFCIRVAACRSRLFCAHLLRRYDLRPLKLFRGGARVS